MGFNRILLAGFAILDAVLLGRFLPSVGIHNASTSAPLWFQALEIARPLFLLSLAFSAFGLATERRWGLILSYVQFPVRFMFVYLSFGFIARIPAFLSDKTGETPAIIAAMILEGIRLLLTITVHVRMRRRHS